MTFPSTREEYTQFALAPASVLSNNYQDLVDWIKSTYSCYPDLISVELTNPILIKINNSPINLPRARYYQIYVAGQYVCRIRQTNIHHELYSIVTTVANEK